MKRGVYLGWAVGLMLAMALAAPMVAQNSYSTLIKNTPGLVGYWRLGEASGNFADSSGQGSTATTASGITYGATGVIAGDSNTAVTFSSSTGASVSNYTPYNFQYNQPFSAEMWFMPGAGVASGNYALLSTMGLASPYTGWEIHCYDGALEFNLYSVTSGDNIQVNGRSGLLTAGVWYHIAVSYNGSGTAAGVSLFVDGAPIVVSATVSGLASQSIQGGHNLVIGNRNGNCCATSGSIDEVAVYNVAVPELTWLYHHNLGLKTLNPLPMSTANVPVIWDNDSTDDVDNYWELATFFQVARAGYAHPIALIVTDGSTYGAVCIDLIARYYGFVLPIGAYQGSAEPTDNGTVCDSYATTYRPGKTRGNYNTDAQAYRTALTAAASSSVVIIVDGPAQGLYDLMNDGNTPSGASLIASKVKHVYWAAGGYPSGSESNFNMTSGAMTSANYVLANWPNTVPIDFMSNLGGTPESGGEYVVIGTSIYTAALGGNPYSRLSGYTGGRGGWGSMNILRALADGSNTYFSVSGSNGNNVVSASTGANTWSSTPNNGMNWVKNNLSDNFYAGMFNSYLYRDGHVWGAIW